MEIDSSQTGTGEGEGGHFIVSPQTTRPVHAPHEYSPTASLQQQLTDQKRPRACESCRGLKVRCEPNADNPYSQCKRCAKAGRDCVFTVPSRKRQKKTDNKVAELERKIDALTASLHATREQAAARAVGDDDDDDDEEDGVDGEEEIDASTSPVPARTVKRKRESNLVSPAQLQSDAEKYAALYPFLAPKGTKIPVSTHVKPVDGNGHTYKYMDVINRQLLGIEMARTIFTHFVEDLVPHFPVVVFPPGTTADQVRQKTPTLFLAILACSSGMNHPDLHRALHKEISRALADKIMINGEKSLELVQALLVTTVWYYPPEHFEELTFYMLIHQAAVMALEIGLGRKSKARPGVRAGGPDGKGSCTPGLNGTLPLPGDRKYGFPNLLPHPISKIPYPDSSAIESRRTLLACYWVCCNVSMALRRPNLLRFTPFMAQCVRDLETNPAAAKSDIILAAWVKLQRIAEDVGVEFAFDQVEAEVSLSEERVRRKLLEFNSQLKSWWEGLPETTKHPHLGLAYHIVSIYTNEIVLHDNHNIDDFRPPYTESSLTLQPPPPHSTQKQPPLTQIHLSAIETCISSAHSAISIFTSLPVHSARSLPMFAFVRCSYACMILLKAYLIISSPKSEFAGHLDHHSLRVGEELDKLIGRLEQVAEDDKCRGASKFVMIVTMLKSWFGRLSGEMERALHLSGEPAASLSRLGLDEGGENVNPRSPSASTSRSPVSIPPSGRRGGWLTPSQDPQHIHFLPPTPPQIQSQFGQNRISPILPPTGVSVGEWMPPEPFSFTGQGEMFTDDSFWAMVDGNTGGLGMFDWSSGF